MGLDSSFLLDGDGGKRKSGQTKMENYSGWVIRLRYLLQVGARCPQRYFRTRQAVQGKPPHSRGSLDTKWRSQADMASFDIFPRPSMACRTKAEIAYRELLLLFDLWSRQLRILNVNKTVELKFSTEWDAARLK